ncbi:MAG: type 2 isopentenyl-diphosphate Delta-isomerase [Acetilactobacillus jinshanensis]
MINQHSHRKDEHVSLAEYFNRNNHRDYFNQLQFVHQSLPETDYRQINPTTKLGPFTLKWPFYIEAMTGGSRQTGHLNAQLATIAKATNLAMAVGSESVALQDPNLIQTFSIVRKVNPKGLIFANLGASHTGRDAKKVIKMINADALEIHLNVPQELIMPEGHRSFHWLKNIKSIVSNVKVPVIVKEVGFGMSKETIRQLKSIGVKYVNVSGRGGTNFAKIENDRRPDQDLSYLDNWGLTTPQSLLEARPFEKKMTVIASGGVKNPLDIAKALALGANAVGVAGVILHSLLRRGTDKTIQMIKDWQRGLKIIMTMLG